MSTEAKEAKCRSAIAWCLESMDDWLGDFEQTCVLRVGPGTIEDVARAMVTCYHEPNASTISNLHQAIRDFKKAEK